LIRARAVALAVAVLAPAGCWRGASDLSPSGKGEPELGIEFPASAAPGSVHTARLRVTNPGPGDISRVAVSFALVGAPAAQGLPAPVVDAGRPRAVVSVSPRPTSVSPDGVVYRFGALPEGGSMTIEFGLRVPRRRGLAANSVTVYDDVDPSRARGVRLETTVEE
jgi:hypothetical protein